MKETRDETVGKGLCGRPWNAAMSDLRRSIHANASGGTCGDRVFSEQQRCCSALHGDSQRFSDNARLISNAISRSFGLSVLSNSTINSRYLGMRSIKDWKPNISPPCMRIVSPA
jgi:hypothetical protein